MTINKWSCTKYINVDIKTTQLLYKPKTPSLFARLSKTRVVRLDLERRATRPKHKWTDLKAAVPTTFQTGFQPETGQLPTSKMQTPAKPKRGKQTGGGGKHNLNSWKPCPVYPIYLILRGSITLGSTKYQDEHWINCRDWKGVQECWGQHVNSSEAETDCII